METVITVSLNGYPYKLTENAYRVLRRYLDALINRFGQSGEAKETYEAIEARIGELLSERQRGDEPLSESAICEVIDILGQPEDIDVDQESKAASSARQSAEEAAEKQRNRMRLYRDEDNKIISGVCAGIAARLGTSVVAIRLLFVIAAFIYGVGIIVYVVLWAAVPAAYTPLQKLRMRGNPITIDSIRGEVNESFKASRDALGSKRQNGSSNFWQSLGNFIAFIALGLTKLLAKILAFAFIIAGAAGVTALTVLLIVALSNGYTLAEELFGCTSATVISLLGWSLAPRIVAVAIWGVCCVPLMWLFIGGMQMLVRFRITKAVSVTSLVFWIACIITLAVLAPLTKWRAEKHLERYDTEYSIPMRAGDTLYVDLHNEPNEGVDAALGLLNYPNIDIRSTSESVASVRIHYYAFHPDEEQINSFDEVYTPTIDSAYVLLPSVQDSHDSHREPYPFNVGVILYLPEGTLIELTYDAARRAEGYGRGRTLHGKELAEKTWQMRDDCLSTPREVGKEREEATPSPANSAPISIDSITSDQTTAI